MAGQRSKSRSGSKADREFVSEAEEILEHMREDLADLNDQRVEGGEADPDLVNRLFRSAHSLKALAGLFGFDPIGRLAHQLEDVLDGLRLGRVSLDSPAVAMIEEAVRLFATLLERVGEEGALEAAAGSIADLSDRIEAVAQGAPGAPDEFGALDLDPSLLRALTEYEEHRLRENLRRGHHILLVDSTFEIISFEEGLSELSEAARAAGEVLSTLPAPGEAAESQIRFSLLVASELDADEFGSRLQIPNASVRCVTSGGKATPEATAKPPAPGATAAPPATGALEAPATTAAPDVAAATADVDRDHAEGARPTAAPAESEGIESLKSISETVRVDIRKLDELMNLVGELVIQRGAIGDLIAELTSDPALTRIAGDFSKVHKTLDRKIKELQSAVLEVRMVPLRQVFEKVSRVVRRLRVELEKDVRLEFRGADTELDKLIVEELVDPLMHVVRNALDHAIEPLEERLAAGKDAQGCIRIEAFQRGNHVVIAVSDDGAGIDTGALRARAESAGVVAPDEVLSDKEILDLIFVPGVSTSSLVTDTSGRGVGMDVVRTNLTALGGIVDVKSTPGRGTTISMTLPITLAIIQSLIVAVADHRFAIPLNSVLETLLIDPAEIQHSQGRELLNLRGEALRLRRLAVEFGLEAPPLDAKQFAVVMGVGELRIGLLVDRLEGQQDTVIKPIQGPVRAVRGIVGATELGGGDPVLVLDVSALVEDAVRRGNAG